MHIWGAKEAYRVGDLYSHEQVAPLREALLRLPGMERVQVDLAQRLVQVLYRTEQLTPGSIEAAIRHQGFHDVRRA